MSDSTQILVIGGGFFGCRIAQHLRAQFSEVMVVEQENEPFRRASYNNQARVHQGYHYPRSLLTALRSRVNFGRFIAEYPECVDRSFEKVYAIGRNFSHVTAVQFRRFCERVGAPLEPVQASVRRLFNPDTIEEAFLAKEFAFDALRLRDRLQRDLAGMGVEIRLGTRAVSVASAPSGALTVKLVGPGGPELIRARQVFNCTYSGINHLLRASSLPVIPLKHEATEMALVAPPSELVTMGVTVMCGPFFSIMPFPPRGLHTLSHVRYTPHHEWHDRQESLDPPPDHRPELRSHQDRMIRDAARYLPCVSDCRYVESLWEVKTVLPVSEQDDSRPILFRPDHGLPGLTCVMGGKIDNVYDVMQELDELHARGGFNR